jgi:hypothetical protein
LVCLVFEHADIASSISYQTPNTKHQTLDEFDFLRIHQFYKQKLSAAATPLKLILENIKILPIR